MAFLTPDSKLGNPSGAQAEGGGGAADREGKPVHQQESENQPSAEVHDQARNTDDASEDRRDSGTSALGPTPEQYDTLEHDLQKVLIRMESNRDDPVSPSLMNLVRLAQEALAQRPSDGGSNEAKCDSTMSALTDEEDNCLAQFLREWCVGTLPAEIPAENNAELRRPLAEEATSQASEAVDMVDERGLISSTSDDFSHTRL